METVIPRSSRPTADLRNSQDSDAEHRILLACALAPAGIDLTAAFGHACCNAFSWGRLQDSAAVNQLRPQLAAHLSALPCHTPDDHDVKAALQVESRALQGRALFMAGELVTVLDALRAADMPAFPFKGPGFAALESSGPGFREMGDIDLLVTPGKIVECVKVLTLLGYEPTLAQSCLTSSWLPRVTPELLLFRWRDSMTLELHWRFGPEWYPVPCSPQDIFPRLEERDFLGSRILWPPAEELLLIHVADGMKSCGFGMRWIADVAQIIRRHRNLDWDRVRRIANRNGGLNNVRVALAVAEELSGAVAHQLGVPALELDLPAAARALAGEARRRKRLATAVRSIGQRIGTDARGARAGAHFRWALQMADYPPRTAWAIIRHLAGPSVADLEAMPGRGASRAAMRLRALRRRLTSAMG